jgi:hypothetical protein
VLTDTPAIVPPIETQPETNLWFTAKELAWLRTAAERIAAEISASHADHRDYLVLVERIDGAIRKMGKGKKK